MQFCHFLKFLFYILFIAIIHLPSLVFLFVFSSRSNDVLCRINDVRASKGWVVMGVEHEDQHHAAKKRGAGGYFVAWSAFVRWTER
jgi:hypothetical protein